MGLHAVYSATFDAHDRSFLLGLPPWCGGLKGYELQAGCVGKIQPHDLGSNPAKPNND